MEEKQLIITTDTASIDAEKNVNVKVSTGQKEYNLVVQTKEGKKEYDVKDTSILVPVKTTNEDQEIVLTTKKEGWKDGIAKIPVVHDIYIKINFAQNSKELIAGIQLNGISPFEVPILLRKAAGSIEQQLLMGQIKKN